MFFIRFFSKKWKKKLLFGEGHRTFQFIWQGGETCIVLLKFIESQVDFNELTCWYSWYKNLFFPLFFDGELTWCFLTFFSSLFNFQFFTIFFLEIYFRLILIKWLILIRNFYVSFLWLIFLFEFLFWISVNF